MRAGLVTALVTMTVAALLAACSSSSHEATPTPTHGLAASEVTRLFGEWACPGRPNLATALVRVAPVPVDPESQPQSEGGRWIVLTSAGSVSFRESTRLFEPSEAGARTITDLRGSDDCRR